ncbi:uncharacterized protein LOC113228184 [Hyposmocoma kahamanoa]|uniref:uncharacterized protein LOC113228184 n=1 Tax=Hyposmocoma kahamanoa TaxID=1477025 RepID=UPI000E6D7630|nr:uncharacterized protein LOC113228184 [Hyposmocoma kahamanoa]
MEVKEEPDLEADPLRDSPHNTAYDMELSSHLDIKIEEEWLDEAREEQELALSHHMTIETTEDKTPQKRLSQNIDTVPEKKPHYNIQSNASSCSVSGVHIDKNLKLTFTPVQLNESLNSEVHTHESERQTNKAILPRANEKGSSVKKKKDKL